MAEFGLFIGWGSPRAGKEAAVGKVFEEAVAYWNALQAAGEIDRAVSSQTAELLRSSGLSVCGPAPWGTPVDCRESDRTFCCAGRAWEGGQLSPSWRGPQLSRNSNACRRGQVLPIQLPVGAAGQHRDPVSLQPAGPSGCP